MKEKLTALLICLTVFTLVRCQQTPSNQLVNGWEVSQDTYNVSLIDSLKKEIERNTFKELNSIIVIKNGELLLETYFNGTERSDIHNPRSVTKTIAATMLGIAIKDGFISSEQQSLSEFYDLGKFDNPDDRKGVVMLEQLMTMSSGFEAYDFDSNSIGNEENMYPTDNWVQWALNLPMAADRNPGDRWYYFTGGAVILGDILDQALPGGLEAYAEIKLFEPLGIKGYQWQYTPQNVANTAGGLSMTPLDFAKYGQLYKNRGKWKGAQILPESWVDQSIKVRYETTIPGLDYGYLFWQMSYEVEGKSYQTYFCGGNGGNKIFIFKDQPLVVVVTASAYGKRYAHKQVDTIMEQYILPAVLD